MTDIATTVTSMPARDRSRSFLMHELRVIDASIKPIVVTARTVMPSCRHGRMGTVRSQGKPSAAAKRSSEGATSSSGPWHS